jgi:uncharacterized protein Yka (UPF0111/DUF47 family)
MVCQDRGEDTIGQLRSLLVTEHETRRRLHTQVRARFSTPLAAEDLFELTERLGAVSERAYGVAREAELSRTAPDPRLGQQVEAIAAAMTPLGAAIRALPDSHAAPLADQALEQLTLAEHAYREAIADLESETDLRRELRRREQYRRCELLAEAVQHLARRTWYAVYKSQ